MYGKSRFDRRAPKSVDATQTASPGSLTANATGNVFWLGHDLMWTADVLLRSGTAKDALIGFDQALHHLDAAGLGATPIGGELRRLRELVQETRALEPSLRDAYAAQLGSIIDRIGAVAEKAQQPAFRVPPHWKRVRH